MRAGKQVWRTVLLALALLSAACRSADWPPPPRDRHEARVIEAASRAALQFDGWTQVACVAERSGGEWKVQAWKIVKPKARGKQKCVPWAVRRITLDSDARVTAYENAGS